MIIVTYYLRDDNSWENKYQLCKTDDEAKEFVRKLIQGNGYCCQAFGTKFGSTSYNYKFYESSLRDDLSSFIDENEKTFLEEGKQEAISSYELAAESKKKAAIKDAIKLLRDNGFDITKEL